MKVAEIIADAPEVKVPTWAKFYVQESIHHAVFSDQTPRFQVSMTRSWVFPDDAKVEVLDLAVGNRTLGEDWCVVGEVPRGVVLGRKQSVYLHNLFNDVWQSSSSICASLQRKNLIGLDRKLTPKGVMLCLTKRSQSVSTTLLRAKR